MFKSMKFVGLFAMVSPEFVIEEFEFLHHVMVTRLAIWMF